MTYSPLEYGVICLPPGCASRCPQRTRRTSGSAARLHQRLSRLKPEIDGLPCGGGPLATNVLPPHGARSLEEAVASGDGSKDGEQGQPEHDAVQPEHARQGCFGGSAAPAVSNASVN